MMQPPEEIRCQGLGVSEGIVIGQVLRMHAGTEHVYHWQVEQAELEGERRRLRAAVDLASQSGIVDQETGRRTFWKGPRLHFRCPSAAARG